MERMIIVRLEPSELTNPDLDLRYAIPDAIVERSGMVEEHWYDYSDQPDGAMLIYLRPKEGKNSADVVLDSVLSTIENVRVLGNDLRPAAVVAIETSDGDRVVYPPNFQGRFTR